MTRKSGRQYADDVRELRAQGVEFPSAFDGYVLADAANWSSGQKAAVTRAINLFDFTEFDAVQARKKRRPKRKPAPKPKRKPKAKPKRKPAPERAPAREPVEPDVEPFEQADLAFFDDGAGDEQEEFSDIDFFDFDESVEFQDDEADQYPEG